MPEQSMSSEQFCIITCLNSSARTGMQVASSTYSEI